jgi:hypothetical protein
LYIDEERLPYTAASSYNAEIVALLLLAPSQICQMEVALDTDHLPFLMASINISAA